MSELYNKLEARVQLLNASGFEPDRIVVPGDEWDGVKDVADVIEGEGTLGGDRTEIAGVRVLWRQQSKAEIIFKVEQ
ncbi:hypothetical protein HFTV1-gp06 [Haloferax tailed virus 1]|uniref:Uncharacterized protein n=1 Tax=Haloferax tailed virus 1 TaxID=2507575 RepID=A0A410N6Q3_HFTV1|nr:hypothetical protein M1M17_gp06 [Haloferax tailed virus 1]QAS68839.1 hypothetical protein HFTV1-gp06 [Haloferax tailed virus 1]